MATSGHGVYRLDHCPVDRHQVAQFCRSVAIRSQHCAGKGPNAIARSQHPECTPSWMQRSFGIFAWLPREMPPMSKARKRQARIVALDQRFRSEAINSKWASAHASVIRTAIVGTPGGDGFNAPVPADSMDEDFRSSMCRISMIRETRADARQVDVGPWRRDRHGQDVLRAQGVTEERDIQKNRCVLCQGVRAKYAFMQAHQREFR